MHSKLAGNLSLQDMITKVLSDSTEKTAAAESDKVKKLVAYEKKEHGHVPTPSEEEAEKKASAVQTEEVEKLASALDAAAEKIAAEGVELGGESTQGGTVLPVMKPVAGKQQNKKDSSKSHNVPTSTGMQAGDAGGPSTQVPNDHAKKPGGAPYPKKGVMKTAEIEKEALEPETSRALVGLGIQAGGGYLGYKNGKAQAERGEKHTIGGQQIAGALLLPGGLAYQAGRAVGHASSPKKSETEKKASAVEQIETKIAKVENGGESTQGGMQLDNTAPVPSNPGREMIASNSAPAAATKAKAKAHPKKQLSQVLSEPALSKAHDSKVHENLRNASKGGVKIAAARALLQKIAAGGCTCSGGNTCKYCKMKSAMSSKA
jgi:hypothetical protein